MATKSKKTQRPHKSDTKTKTTKKSEPKKQPKEKPHADAAHVTYLKERVKEEGPCAGVRALAKRYSSLNRGQVIAVAKAAGVNAATAGTQYQVARSES